MPFLVFDVIAEYHMWVNISVATIYVALNQLTLFDRKYNKTKLYYATSLVIVGKMESLVNLLHLLQTQGQLATEQVCWLLHYLYIANKFLLVYLKTINIVLRKAV